MTDKKQTHVTLIDENGDAHEVEGALFLYTAYRETQSLGLGYLRAPGAPQSLEETRDYLNKIGGVPPYVDYYHGRPFKLYLDQPLDGRDDDCACLFDRDQGNEALSRVIAATLAKV